MKIFNSIISHLGLVKIPLKGRKFTCSNMQASRLLEQLDWCFSSLTWTSHYLNTLLIPLAKTVSDHIPCKVQIGTKIPKAHSFRFEIFWINQPGFMELVQATWSTSVRAKGSASIIAAKFKNIRRVLKRWSKDISKLANVIKESNGVLAVLDKLEERSSFYPRKQLQNYS
jgi:hypothetical protein